MADLHNITSPIAKATAAAPSYTEGDVAGLSQDLGGALRIAGTVTASLTFPTIGAAVPSTGIYNGLNVAGTLRGMTGVNPSGSIYATQVDVASIAGTTAVNGSGTATGALRVELPTNGTGKVGLNAGSAVIGSVSTNQTTPLTTDLITARYARSLMFQSTFTPATGYTIGQNIGGKFTVATGLAAGTVVKIIRAYGAISAGTVTVFTNPVLFVFNADPTTTFADAAAPTWNSADNSKVVAVNAIPVNITALVGVVGMSFNFTYPYGITTDASGNIYFVLQSGGTNTLVTPAASFIALELGY